MESAQVVAIVKQVGAKRRAGGVARRLEFSTLHAKTCAAGGPEKTEAAVTSIDSLVEIPLCVDSSASAKLYVLHLALAFFAAATHVLTFDRRMRKVALQSSPNVIDVNPSIRRHNKRHSGG
jgi:hypothetical protein